MDYFGKSIGVSIGNLNFAFFYAHTHIQRKYKEGTKRKIKPDQKPKDVSVPLSIASTKMYVNSTAEDISGFTERDRKTY